MAKSLDHILKTLPRKPFKAKIYQNPSVSKAEAAKEKEWIDASTSGEMVGDPGGNGDDLAYPKGPKGPNYPGKKPVKEEAEDIEEMAFTRLNTGESEGRTKEQGALGKHINKIFNRGADVEHHPKGGLVVKSKLHGKMGNNKHVREMSKTLDSHGIPHRYEESDRWGRHKDHLYVLSHDAHEEGKKHMPEKKSVAEEVDRLDEISKKTLGSYVKKSVEDKEERSKAISNMGGVTTDHNGDPTLRGSNKLARIVSRKQNNRAKGINTAVDKLTKEDVEQIDELSKEKLGRYTKRASREIGATSWMHGNNPARDLDKDSPRKVKNREVGVSRAVDRLTKEDKE